MGCPCLVEITIKRRPTSNIVAGAGGVAGGWCVAGAGGGVCGWWLGRRGVAVRRAARAAAVLLADANNTQAATAPTAGVVVAGAEISRERTRGAETASGNAHRRKRALGRSIGLGEGFGGSYVT